MADPTQSAVSLERAGVLATEAIARFRALEPARRTRLLGVAAILVACVAGLVWYGTRTDWRTLYAGLDGEDARQMAQELTAAGIPFDVSPDGSALRVPAEDLDKARLTATAKGAPASGRMGFELFDKPNWMGSEFDEQVNYQRALEGELEHTIETLGSVESARVDLVLPHDSLFTADQREAKASVVLRLRRRTLTNDESAAIANLVASAVDGLKPENVVLVDAKGGGLLGRPGGDAALAEREQEMAGRLVETLEPVAGAGNVRASVTVDYDPNSAEETDESYDPAQSATLTMQRSEQTSGQAPASGIPGTASNMPNAKPPLYPAATPSLEDMKQESDTYGVSKKERRTVEPPGRVRRLTAAVLINFRPVAKGKQTAWQPRSPAEMQEITQLAENAIGFDQARGDQVSVEQLAFEDNAALPPPSLGDRALALASRAEPLLRNGTALLGMLVFFFLVARPALRALAASPRPAAPRAAAAAALPGAPAATPREITPEHLAAEQRKQRAQSVFEQVAESVKREPAQSTRLLESWIRSE
jgi:flagellar M-ring protein FliF